MNMASPKRPTSELFGMIDPEIPEPPEGSDRGQKRTSRSDKSERMPFDTSDLRQIPTANDDDPPYRNWWVGDER